MPPLKRETPRRRPGRFVESWCVESWLGGLVQSRQLATLGEARQRLLLDLADPLGRDAEPAAGLAQRRGLLATEAEAKLNDVALALGQAAHGKLHGGRAGVLHNLVLDGRLLRRD